MCTTQGLVMIVVGMTYYSSVCMQAYRSQSVLHQQTAESTGSAITWFSPIPRANENTAYTATYCVTARADCKVGVRIIIFTAARRASQQC